MDKLYVSKGKYRQVKYKWSTRKRAQGSPEVKL